MRSILEGISNHFFQNGNIFETGLNLPFADSNSSGSDKCFTSERESPCKQDKSINSSTSRLLTDDNLSMSNVESSTSPSTTSSSKHTGGDMSNPKVSSDEAINANPSDNSPSNPVLSNQQPSESSQFDISSSEVEHSKSQSLVEESIESPPLINLAHKTLKHLHEKVFNLTSAAQHYVTDTYGGTIKQFQTSDSVNVCWDCVCDYINPDDADVDNLKADLKSRIMMISKSILTVGDLVHPLAVPEFSEKDIDFGLANKYLKEDSNLRILRFNLVPKYISERRFWNSYFWKIHLAIIDFQNDYKTRETSFKGDDEVDSNSSSEHDHETQVMVESATDFTDLPSPSTTSNTSPACEASSSNTVPQPSASVLSVDTLLLTDVSETIHKAGDEFGEEELEQLENMWLLNME